MLDVDVQLQTAGRGVAQGDLDAAQIVRMQLDAYATIAGQAVQISLVGELGDDLRWLGG